MNQRAREVLVKAALDGVKQTKFALYDGEGFCAIGVLMASLHPMTDWTLYSGLSCPPDDMYERVLSEYTISESEWLEIVDANNVKEWSFLDIARKLGNDGELQ